MCVLPCRCSTRLPFLPPRQVLNTAAVPATPAGAAVPLVAAPQGAVQGPVLAVRPAWGWRLHNAPQGMTTRLHHSLFLFRLAACDCDSRVAPPLLSAAGTTRSLPSRWPCCSATTRAGGRRRCCSRTDERGGREIAAMLSCSPRDSVQSIVQDPHWPAAAHVPARPSHLSAVSLTCAAHGQAHPASPGYRS